MVLWHFMTLCSHLLALFCFYLNIAQLFIAKLSNPVCTKGPRTCRNTAPITSFSALYLWFFHLCCSQWTRSGYQLSKVASTIDPFLLCLKQADFWVSGILRFLFQCLIYTAAEVVTDECVHVSVAQEVTVLFFFSAKGVKFNKNVTVFQTVPRPYTGNDYRDDKIRLRNPWEISGVILKIL